MNERIPKEKKEKNYRFRSRLFKAIGLTLVSLTTIGGFVVYESIIDWKNFKEEMGNFVLVNDRLELNLLVAGPFLIAILVVLIIMLRKNREFLKGKISINLLIITGILYLIYSIIVPVMVALGGALVGSVFNEFIFEPLAASARIKAADQKEEKMEYRKEAVRIKARRKAQEDLDGSV